MINPIIAVQQKIWAAQNASLISGKTINPKFVTSSKLRRDTALVNGQVYTGISFNGTGIVPNASEILLGQNDAFLCTAARLTIKKLTATPTDALHKQAREFTYPNTFVFDGTTEVLAVFAVWNSYLTITQNSSVRFPKLYTGDFLFAPDQQYGDITGLIAGPVYSRKLNDSKNSPNYGYAGIEPFLLVGTDQSNFTLNMNVAQNLTESSEFNFFTICLDGFLISGN